jgi:hypothetical protein
MVKQCVGCSQEFEAMRHDKDTCSRACQRRVAWRRARGLPISGQLEGRQKVAQEPKECEHCKKTYIPFRKRSRFCSDLCNAQWHYAQDNTVQRERKCKGCGNTFFYDGSNRLWHCSDDCAVQSARKARAAGKKTAAQWRKDHPEETKQYRKNWKERDPLSYSSGLTQRFFKRYPHLQKVCQACGEKRVVELAHKIPRNGAYRSLKNTTDKDVWILCPTCHRCLDFGIQTKEELGLPD